MDSGTYRRFIAAQVWPVLMNAPQKRPSAISLALTSSSTRPASLPPSSNVTRASDAAVDSTILRPVSVEPVNISLSMPWFVDNAAPTLPSPVTTLSTPSGRTVLMTLTSAKTDSGVYSEGFITTVLPMRNAGANCQTEIIMGQFHGPIAPTTPSGR